MMKYTILLLLFQLGQASFTQQIDVRHQAFSLKPVWEEQSLAGHTTLEIAILAPTKSILLEGRRLEIDNVKAEKELSFNYHAEKDKDNLSIELDRTYDRGESITVTISYSTRWINETDPNNIWGSLGAGVRFFEPSTTEPNRQKQIWSVGEPEGNQFWFPGNFDNSDFRTTELSLTVAKPLQVLSNGRLTSIEDNKDGTRTFQWKTDQPYPPHLTSFVVGKYLPVTQTFGEVEIISACYPHEADATAATVERLPDMMDFYSMVTGISYPFPSYTQIFVQEFAGWQGNMMTSTITENMVDDWVTHKDFKWLWDIVESEALASQWFGVHIVPTSWYDAWLTKGLSRHLAGLYNEYRNGSEEYLSYQYSPQLTTYLNDWNSGNIQPVVNLEPEDITPFVRSNHPYLHGATVLHMLRKQVGDEVWMRIIKNFSQKCKGKNATTEDFIAIVNEELAKDSRWFFNQWVFGIGHPVFEVRKTWDEKEKTLVLSVDQLQQLDTLETKFNTTEFFQGKMWLELDSQVEEIYIEPKKENTYLFKLAKEPGFVNFDFESSWVKEERLEKSSDEWLNQFLYSKDILARINALGQLGNIANQESPLDEKKKIYHAMRSVILSSESYWRLKMLTLWQLQSLLVNNGELHLDKTTEAMLLSVIQDEESWVKSSAVWFLGMTRDPKYSALYIDLFDDWSDRVTNAAAIALGKTKSLEAYDALVGLKDKPSWKNQSLISALNGLQWLQDQRGAELALESLRNNEAKHWTLATPTWDHRLAAANTLGALGAGDQGYETIYHQLRKAVEEEQLNDVLYNALQLVNLSDPRGKHAFEELKQAYQNDPQILIAIKNYEEQLLSKLD